MSVNNIGQIVALGAIGVVSISSVLVGIFYPEFFTGDIKLFGTNEIAPPLVEIIERIESTVENEDTINDTIETPVTPVVIAESIDDNNIEPILEEVTILLDETTEEKKPSKNKTKSKSKKEEKHGSTTSTKKHKKSHKEKILINPDIIQPL